MSDTVLKPLGKLIERVNEYEKKPDQKKLPKLRQDVTNLLKRAEDDPEITDILLGIREVIGIGDDTDTRKTAADLVKEYDEKYISMTERQRSAFKAQITKRKNEAVEAGNEEETAVYEALAQRIESESEAIRRSYILKLGGKFVKK